MIADAHQHFWDKDRFNYPWLTPEMGCLYRNFLPEDLEPLIKFNSVSHTIVVQALSSIDETYWLLGLAEQNDFIAGVVGWVDLTDQELFFTLEKLAKYLKFIGIRHQVEDEADREWLIRENVLLGLEKAMRFGLRFDALLKHDQLWQLDIVARRCPTLGIVIDHCAKPNIKDSAFEVWAEHINEAAKLPIYCKLSGLITEADHERWTIRDLKPYADYILAVFGTKRVMFGSDWPVSTMASDYGCTLKTYIELLSELSEEERQDILYSNTIKFYGL
ncbi:MAG: amidohydrolase family protein [Eubacteriales bacterium]|nr:amidohydrolase family protein [Eubacteriales bacterium]